MFRVRNHFQGELFVILSIKEPGNLVHLIRRNIWKDVLSAFHIATQHESLVFQKGNWGAERNDSHILVGQINPRVALEMPEKVFALVKIRNRVSLVAYKVVKTICSVGIDEAVPDPLTASNLLVDISYDLEGQSTPSSSAKPA